LGVCLGIVDKALHNMSKMNINFAHGFVDKADGGGRVFYNVQDKESYWLNLSNIY
jgi:hypothetical protein